MTTDALTLRRFRPDDTEALSDLWLAASLGAHGFLGAERLAGQRALIGEVYLPQSDTMVAWQDGVPVGFLSLLGDFIGALFVAPDRQGQGIGARLLAEAAARRDALELEVYAENAGALRFYSAQGFREVSRRPQDDQGLPFETIRMRRAPL